MPRYSTAFGMGARLRSTAVCALDAETGEAAARRFRGNPWGEVAERVPGFPGPSPAAYESGCLGFAPQRGPSPEIEGLRDLAAAHDAATAGLAAAKRRPLALLARRGRAYGGTTPAGNPRKYWTYDFLRWLDKVRPEDDGGVRTLAALRNEVEAAAEVMADLLSECRAAVAAGPLSAEVGDFTRFRSGRQVTAYFGLAPSQRSSGDSVRLGGISGAGNALVRKLAVEGSWCYAAARHQPKLMPRDTGVPLEIRMRGGEGVRAAPAAARGDARPRHARGEGQRGHRGRAREVALGPRRDVPGGNRIDIAPITV